MVIIDVIIYIYVYLFVEYRIRKIVVFWDMRIKF